MTKQPPKSRVSEFETLDDFLSEEGVLNEVTARAQARVDAMTQHPDQLDLDGLESAARAAAVGARYRARVAFIAAWNPAAALSILSRLRASEAPVKQLSHASPCECGADDQCAFARRTEEAEALATSQAEIIKGLHAAVSLAVDLVERDVIRVRPTEREELIAALTVWNAALTSTRTPAEGEGQ